MKNASPKPNALPATDWTAGLRSLDLDGIRPVFDELAGHENDAARGLGADRRRSDQDRRGAYGRPAPEERGEAHLPTSSPANRTTAHREARTASGT